MELERKVYHEQIQLIYNQGPILVAGAALCALLMTAFLWRFLPHATLIPWLGALGVCTVLRIWSIVVYLRADSRTRERACWGPLFWLGTLTAGMIWGAWPLIFYELYSTEYLLLISTIFAGMVAVSAASGCVYLPSFLTFSIPLILPLALTHLFSGNDMLILTGLLLIMFLAVNFFLAVRGHRRYRELIRSQLTNEELMEKLAEEKRIAERAIVAKSRFLASASHDLRQPLHAMGLFLSALHRRENDPDKVEILNDMSRSAEALNGLFNSLLDVSRLDAEIIEVNPTHQPADEIFEGLRAQFTAQAEARGLSLQVDSGAHVLFADSILLERVLRNLLSNAIQYTHSGGIRLYCEDDLNGSKRITLEDTGIGIPADSHEDVFSEYYQLNNPSRDRANGLGLGLAIVRRLCELMRLPLEMESEPDRGTVFRLLVPGGDPAQLRTNVPVASKPLQASGHVVLVIDDERQVLQGMRHLLEGWGCTVLLAESARDALKVLALSGYIPELILSDYRLRDNQNGVDAVMALRESLESPVPAIIITGDTSPARLREISVTGLQVLHKPVDSDELQTRLQQLLQSSDMRRESGVGSGSEPASEAESQEEADGDTAHLPATTVSLA